MAKTTGIAWTRSSWNPWIGCTEVSPGCDNCYARALDALHKWGGATHWGPGVPRHRTSFHYWKQPMIWNRAAEHERITGKVLAKSLWKGRPGFWPVFPSLCDPFDNEVPEEWRADFWRLIRATPTLTYLLLTKRIGNVIKMLPTHPFPMWHDGWHNVWIGASIVNPDELRRDLPKLRAIPAARRFVSYEPAIEAVDWTGQLDGIHQVIVGGESNQGGKKARPFDTKWARSTVRQCKEAGVAVFVKQIGSNPVSLNTSPHDNKLYSVAIKDRAGADPAEWPEDLRVQEFPK